MAIDWVRFRELVSGAQSFVLTSHMRPDCDALGSELGMAEVLEALGKRVRIVNGDVTPPHLRFIDPVGRVETLGRDVQPVELAGTDIMMVLDTSAWIQLGPMADVLRASDSKKLVVDHHVSEDDLGAITFKNTTAEATGRLVIEAADALGVPLTREIAEPLFSAIATDTGWFRFSSVSGETFRQVARLVEVGVRPQTIYTALYEQDSLARILLRGRILSKSTVECEGRLAHSAADLADFAACRAQTSDTEDVINTLLAISGVEAALLFVELEGGKVKISFRSRGINVREVAEQFGGGGHTVAAGAMVAGSLAVVQEKILDAMRKAMP